MIRTITAICVVFVPLVCAGQTIIPSAAIESEEVFDRDLTVSGGVLQDVIIGSNQPATTRWLKKGTTTIAQIRGFGHAGKDPVTPGIAAANLRVESIAIWSWRDSNGDGAANAADATTPGFPVTTTWTKLTELTPELSSGDGSGGNVVGWNVTVPADNFEEDFFDGTWGDVIQVPIGTAIPTGPAESWILLIIVTNTLDGCSNVCRGDPVEIWEDGDTGNAIGSNVESDKYWDHNGIRAGGPFAGSLDIDERLQDNDFVWIYIPKN
jgi:hypothetical protein